MKRKIYQFGLLTLGILLTTIIVLSNANGPGGDRTGAPGSSGNCSSCHGGTANLGGDIVITAVDASNASVATSYEPGKKYTIGIKMGGTSIRKGFQATVLDASNKGIGTMNNPSAGSTTYTSGTRTIAGHNTPGLGVWTFDWTAPATSAGNVTIHASGVVSNANNNDNGDQVVKTSLTLTAPVSTVKNTTAPVLTAFPNPCTDKLTLSQSLHSVQIIDINGSTLMKLETATSINTASLAHGQYFIVAKDAQEKAVHFRFVKN
jgi:hypothetical protein